MSLCIIFSFMLCTLYAINLYYLMLHRAQQLKTMQVYLKNIYYFCPYACIIKMNKLCSDENIRVWHFFTTNKVLAVYRVTWEHSGEQQVSFICIYSQRLVNNLHILPSIVSNHQNLREWNTRYKTISLNTTKLPKY